MFAIIYVSNGYIFYGLTYLELWPTYQCDKRVIPVDENCNHEAMCQREQGLLPESVISVNWTSHTSLHNWVDRLDLVCEQPWKIGFIGSMYQFGWAMGCLFVPRLGDVLGRRLPFFISLGCSVLVYLGLILSQNILLTMTLFFFLGLSTPGKSNIAYVYLLELVPTDWQTYVGTALLFADGSTMIILSLYFRYLTKDWLAFQIYGISATALAFFAVMLAPESPKYLYSYKKYERARASLAHIARINRVDRGVKYIFDTEYQEDMRNRKSIRILSASWDGRTALSQEIVED